MVRSADGTSIASEVFGEGPTLITVRGATCDRALMRPTAQAVVYDGRRRGDSGDTWPRSSSGSAGGRPSTGTRPAQGWSCTPWPPDCRWSGSSSTIRRTRVLAGQDHVTDPEVLVPLVVDFLTS